MTIESKKIKAAIVSNESDSALALESRLIALGYEIDHHPKSMTTPASENHPDLALVNVLMADETGRFPGADAICPRRHTPVVYFGHPSARERLNGFPVPPFFYLACPFSDQDIKEVVEMALYVAALEESRRQAEEALSENLAFLKTAGEMANVAGWEINAQTFEITPTDQILRMAGLTSDDAPTFEKAFSYIHPDDRERAETGLKQALETGKPYDMEIRLQITETQKDLWARIICYPHMVDGRVVKLKGTFHDITDRKRDELNFQKEKTLLKAIIDSIPVMITRYEPDANILYLNKYFEKRLGWTTEEIRNIDLMEQIYPDPGDRRDALAYMREATAQWKVFQLRSKSGQVIDSEWSNIELEDGTQIGIGIDISERKRSEAILKESERKFRSITEQIAETVFLVDRQRIITYMSPAAEEYFGFKIEDMLHRPITMFLARDNAAWDVANFLTKIEKGIPFQKLKLRMRRREGTVFIGELTGRNYLKAGKDAGTIGIIRDITEDKKKADELKARQVFLDRVIDQSPFATFITDAEGTLQRANPALKKFLNLTDEQLVGQYNVFQDPQLEQQGLIPQFREVYEKGLTLNFTCDWEGQKIPDLDLDGSNFVSIEATMFPIYGSEGELQNVVFNWIDITARRRAEAEKKKLEKQLRQSQKMQAIGTLAGGIAHDFNNLLQAILGHTQIMLLDKDKQNHDYGHLKAIQTAGDRAAQLVNQLLLFSRKAGTSKKSISLNREIDHILKAMKQSLPGIIHIDFRPGPSLWPINADRIQIEQALMSLGVNAAESMPSGGQLLIETINMTFDDDNLANHAELKAGRYVRLSVSDSGYGIHGDILPRIFEPFFTTKEFGQGSGMGLASVYGIVKNHGGHILCHSRPGHGTTFRIYLPAIEEAPSRLEASQPPPPTPVDHGRRQTILLVDDDEAIRDTSSSILERFEYNVLLAASGEEALAIFQHQHENIDLVILDLGMPGMGGQRCLGEMLGIKPAARIIIASGSTMETQIEKSLATGAAGFLGKPYSFQDLLDKVREVMDRPKGA